MEEQEMVRTAVREFAENEIAPVAREYDEAEKFPRPNKLKVLPNSDFWE